MSTTTTRRVRRMSPMQRVELYEPLAIKYARWAWRWALKSQEEGSR